MHEDNKHAISISNTKSNFPSLRRQEDQYRGDELQNYLLDADDLKVDCVIRVI